MPLAGKAVMINWSDVSPEDRPAYYEWHNREHMPGAMDLPGFQRGRRYIAVDADRDFFNCYEVDDLGVLTGTAYRTKVNNPSELTLKRSSSRSPQHSRREGKGASETWRALQLQPSARKACASTRPRRTL